MGRPLWRLREKVPGAQAEGALSSLGAQGEGALSSEQQNMNGLGCGGEQDGIGCVSVRGGWRHCSSEMRIHYGNVCTASPRSRAGT